MGNQKFKLSDMLPNAWFVKLKYMGTKTAKTKHHHHHSSSPSLSTPNKKHSISATKSKPVGASVAAEVQQQPYLSQARKSYHFTREHNNDPRSKMSDSYNNNHLIPDPPRKSAKRRSTKRKSTPTTVTTTRYSPSSSCSSPSTTKVVNSSASSGCSSGAVDAFRPKSNSHPPPPSPINDVPYLPESDHLSILPQFCPPDHVLLSSGSETLHPTGGGGRACSSATCTCKLDSSSAAATDDVVIDVDEKSLAKRDGKTVVDDGIDSISRLVELRPILTKKPTAFNHLKTRDSVDESSVEYKRTSNLTGRRENDDKSSLSSLKFTQGEEENDTNFKGRHDGNNNRNKIRTPMRRFVVSSPGVGVGLRLRLSSPRIGRKLSAGGSATGNGTGRKSLSSGGSRKSISESFAIVKSSFDPQKDFRESMVEMIVQNNIKDTKELEELLAAYLSLNSDEYHGVIINVFKQIWFDLNHIRQRQRKAVDRRSVVAGNY